MTSENQRDHTESPSSPFLRRPTAGVKKIDEEFSRVSFETAIEETRNSLVIHSTKKKALNPPIKKNDAINFPPRISIQQVTSLRRLDIYSFSKNSEERPVAFANKLQNLHIDSQKQMQKAQQSSRELISYFSTFSRHSPQPTAKTQSTSESADYHHHSTSTQTPTRQPQKSSKKRNQPAKMTSKQINQLIEQIVARALQQTEHGPPGPPGPPEPAGSSEPQDPQDLAENDSMAEERQFNPEDIEYFDLNFENRSAATGDAIAHSEKDTYYKNVHVFVEKIKKMAIVLDVEIVRRNLSSCLRKTIFM